MPEQHLIVFWIIKFYQRILQDSSGLLDMHRSSFQLAFSNCYFGKKYMALGSFCVVVSLFHHGLCLILSLPKQ